MSNLTRVLQNATCIVISILYRYRKGQGRKKNTETKWPIGPWGIQVSVCAESYQITQTLGDDLDTGKIR